MNTQTLNQIVAGLPMIDTNAMRLTQNGALLPYIADHVFCQYGKNFFTAFAENWMDKRYDSSTEIYHTEESQQIYTVKVAADVPAGAAGGQVVVPYIQNTNAGFTNVQAGYFVGVPPLAKLAKVISVNVGAKTMVIEPGDIQYKIALKANQELIVAPAAIAASCSCDVFPSSMKTPGLMYKSQMMIIKKFLRICGEDLAQWLMNRWLFPLMSAQDPCKEVEVWWHGDLDQMWFEFMYAKQMYAMIGEDITNTSANFTGLKSTTGIIHLLRGRATQEPVPASVGITIDYFRRIGKKLKGMRNYCDQYGVWSGSEHRSQIDMTFETLGNVQRTEEMSCAFMGKDLQRCLQFGFSGIKLDGIEYYFHDETSLNDPGFLGAEGFTGPETTFMVPLCKLPCGNKMSTAFIMRYLSGNGVNRELIERDYGILRADENAFNPTGGPCDYHEWMLMSQFGIDAYCLNNFIFTESI
jgi:hypothetical protein